MTSSLLESLDNLETYDDLKDWLEDVDLFMEAMCHSPHVDDLLWQEARLKNQKETSKLPEESSESIFYKPWTKELEGLTPIQSWQHWMNENTLRVEMGIPLLAHPKHKNWWIY